MSSGQWLIIFEANKLMKYRPEIDGMRGIAVASVLLFHAGFPLFEGGYIGVDIFFVISGYLISTIILTELDEATFSFKNFYERRVRRIYPALIVVVVCCFPVAWFVMLPSQLEDFSKSAVATMLFASNIFFRQNSGYFAAAEEEKPLLHTWSLSIEEQFYIVFPMFIFLFLRFGRTKLAVSIFFVACFSLLLSQWAYFNRPIDNFYYLLTRAWELLSGTICAFYTYRFEIRPNKFLSYFGFVLLLVPIFSFSSTTPIPGVIGLIPTLGVALVITSISKRDLVYSFLSSRYLVALGLVSYSLYLWHQPVLAFLRVIYIGDPPDLVIILALCLAVALAYVTWRFVELPFRDRSTIKASSKKVISMGGLTSFVIILLGSFFAYNKGFPNRFEMRLGGDVGHDEFHQFVDASFVDCEPSSVAQVAMVWNDFLRCKQSMMGAPEIVLLGDSHAEHLFAGLAQALPDVNVAFYPPFALPYIDNVQYREVFNALANRDEPALVLLTMHYLERVRSVREFEENFGQTIEFLQSHDHQVVLVGDIPRFGIPAEACLFTNSSEKVAEYCSIPFSEYYDQRNIYHSSLIRLSQTYNIDYIEIDSIVCDVTRCSMVSGSNLLYRDNNHLNLMGTQLVGQYIADKIRNISY